MFYGLDPTYLYYVLPALLFGLWAQWHVRSTFSRYARVPTSSGVTGAQTAQLLMQRTGHEFGVASTPGMLTDYYDPSHKTMFLSQSSVQNSVASVAVVAHEFGHAIQDVEGYAPMRLRGAIVPAVSASAWLGPLLFLAGWYLSSPQLLWAGIIAFGAAVVFAIVTLPVELNASSRALQMLQSNRILSNQELPAAQAVLGAAAMTYLAAVAQTVATLLYYLSIAGRRR